MIERMINWFGMPTEGMDRRQHLHLVFHLSMRLFLVLAAYYLMKPVREQLVLSEGSAELRSYALSLQAAVLIILFPVYISLSRSIMHERLYSLVTLFFIGCLLIFITAIYYQTNIGFLFFIWTGVFSVMQVTQFWVLATDFVEMESGKYIVPWIAAGGTIGAMGGAILADILMDYSGDPALMLAVSALFLLLSLFNSPANSSHKVDDNHSTAMGVVEDLIHKLKQLAESEYIKWIIVFVVLLNLLNSIGEYYLSHLVLTNIGTSGHAIGNFYADYFLAINVMTVVIQILLVPWFYRRYGLGIALVLVAAVDLVMFGFGLIISGILIMFAAIKALENAIGYSLGSTLRQLLFLPLGRHERYHGMMLANGFFWRVGDLLQGGLIFLIVDFMQWPKETLLVIGIILSLIWIYASLHTKKKLEALCAEQKKELGE